MNDSVNPPTNASVTVHVADVANLPPVADAGPDFQVDEQSLVQLDGSASHADCGNLTYAWSQLGGSPVILSDPGGQSPTFEAPAVCSPEDLAFHLTVDDGSDIDEDDVVVTLLDAIDEAPVADAGQDQTVDEGALVTLDGSGSSDDCGGLNHLWEQLSGPAVTLSDPAAPVTQFTAPPVCLDDDLVFLLTVDDGAQQVSAEVTVHVTNVGVVPTVADAGTDREVEEQSLVQLDGSASHADCGDLEYSWSQVGGPDVTLTGADTATPTFEAPAVCAEMELTFRLVVTDIQQDTAEDEVVITVLDSTNATPVADAGEDQQVDEGDLVVLDGSGSSDDCGPLAFAWSQVDGPVVELQGADTDSPSFVAPQVNQQTVIVLRLTVDDGTDQSDSDQVEISVRDLAANQPPDIVEGANGSATVGVAYLYDKDGRAEASGDEPISWERVDGPADFRIDEDTGAVSWTPVDPGETSITIRASNEHGDDDYTFTVQVEEEQTQPPMAFILTNPFPPEGNAPLEVFFDGSQSISTSSEIISFKWTLGDGSPVVYEETTTHVYIEPGGYLARLTVTDARGMTDTGTVSISVTEAGTENHPPSAEIVASDLEGTGTLNVLFSCDCGAGSAPIALYLWDFGDGNYSDQAQADHTYQPGSYRVWLTVLDDNGLSAYDWVDVVVYKGENQPPVVEAGAEPLVGPAPLGVQFFGLAVDVDGEIEQRGWDFGDGTSASQERAEHVYTEPGIFHATFQAEDDGGLVGRATVEIAVLSSEGARPPEIISRPNLQAEVGQPYRYDEDGLPSARGTPPVSWRFGELSDGSPGAPEGMEIDPQSGEITWTPAGDQAGEHPVVLMAENEAGRDLQSFMVSVPETEADGGADCGCAGTGTDFSAFWVGLFSAALFLRRRRRQA